MPSIHEIRTHLEAQYKGWEKIIYPGRRTDSRAVMEVIPTDGVSGYQWSTDKIILFVPEGNMDDLKHRLGQVKTTPDRDIHTVNEIELLHEMMHEMQAKSIKTPTTEGIALHARFGNSFSGAGHDRTFFTAIALSARLLGVSEEHLVAFL